MMAAPSSAFEVRRKANEPLSFVEQRVLDICKRAALESRELDSIESMTTEIGANGVATVPGIMKRLEEKGYITRTIYQKGRVVCINGVCTLPPKNLAPHWRNRTECPPTPAIQPIRERAKPIASMIETESRLLGKTMTDFLADLVYIGWHEYQAEKDSERG